MNQATSRLKWSQNEDQLLRNLRETQKIKEWKLLAKRLNKINNNIQFPRNAKQCRDRYVNFARFSFENLQSGSWESSELKLLIRSFLKYGAHWKKISQFFLEKSENCVKNKMNSIIRKIVTKIKNALRIEDYQLRRQLDAKKFGKSLEGFKYSDEQFQFMDKPLKYKITLFVTDSFLLIEQAKSFERQALLRMLKIILCFNDRYVSFRRESAFSQKLKEQATYQEKDKDNLIETLFEYDYFNPSLNQSPKKPLKRIKKRSLQNFENSIHEINSLGQRLKNSQMESLLSSYQLPDYDIKDFYYQDNADYLSEEICIINKQPYQSNSFYFFET